MIIVRTMNVGMCNQLFAYAYARYLAEKTGQELYLDYSHIAEADMKHRADYEDALGHFQLKTSGILHNKEEYEDLTGRLGKKLERLIHPVWIRRKYRLPRLLHQEEKKGELLWKEGIGLNLLAENLPSYFEQPVAENIILYGYWQTPVYARSIQEKLCKEIRPDSSFIKTQENMINKLKSSESVCMHIRRGDYLGNQMHEVCKEQYYLSAMDYYIKRLDCPVFYVFSDDIEYVKNRFRNKYENVIAVDMGLRDYEELFLMSCCRHFILSNSSFSWWAQFLSGSRSVVAPDRWYGVPDKKTLLREKCWVSLPSDGGQRRTEE